MNMSVLSPEWGGWILSLAPSAPFHTIAQAAGGGGDPLMRMLVPMLCMVGIFYFLLIRPQMRKEKERKKTIEAIKSGDRILFSGGILGTVANVKDQTFTVKIADNVKIEVARGAVARVLDKGEEPGDVEKPA